MGSLTRSANEVMALASKAARGAGAPPAQAAHFGRAAVAHLLSGFEVDQLQTALGAVPSGPILLLPLAVQAIAEQAIEGKASAPLWDAGFTLLAQSYVAVLPYGATLDLTGLLTLDLNTAALRRVPGRIVLPEAVAAEWAVLAARLLVPDTDASRQSGAGASLTDND